MELSGTTTFQDFDGYGKANHLGDHMLSLTAGFSFNIGKVGWKRAVDTRPYERHNEWLTGQGKKGPGRTEEDSRNRRAA